MLLGLLRASYAFLEGGGTTKFVGSGMPSTRDLIRISSEGDVMYRYPSSPKLMLVNGEDSDGYLPCVCNLSKVKVPTTFPSSLSRSVTDEGHSIKYTVPFS
eukprot:CAMPEP_0196166472 /NCGR_PEP_ID=MMETSP0911-20130528/1998_1 /TAXON_ID=49265 /ORGANISM="Thalassiosira rotula, Strain GSO102" /LENGTH=100 /DNA_ID=CAMNT_0041432117 /DNA_START=162 /DNA_END=461 /DNA_ORIENTATION=+